MAITLSSELRARPSVSVSGRRTLGRSGRCLDRLHRSSVEGSSPPAPTGVVEMTTFSLVNSGWTQVVTATTPDQEVSHVQGPGEVPAVRVRGGCRSGARRGELQGDPGSNRRPGQHAEEVRGAPRPRAPVGATTRSQGRPRHRREAGPRCTGERCEPGAGGGVGRDGGIHPPGVPAWPGWGDVTNMHQPRRGTERGRARGDQGRGHRRRVRRGHR